jgi:hypothetical protein
LTKTELQPNPEQHIMAQAQKPRDNVWSVFWWGLLVCLLLAFVAYLFG